MAKKVYLGVGHGGKDPGAVAFGRKEKDMALDIAKACRDELVRHGVNVMLSRESDVSENLASRIKECNAFNPDLAADIHLNAGKGDGAEVFHSKADTSDDILAKNILDEITKIGQNSRGLKVKLLDDGRDYFGFVRQIKCDSVLVESAFIDNATDVKIVDTLAERKAMGVAIAKGILKTLGITYKAKVTNLYEKGRKITLKNVNLYPNSATKKVSRVISGKYYIYDGKNFLGRYRITNAAKNVGKKPVGSYVTGYIKKSDIK